ncbi:MAG: hypothetical protein LAT50_12145 [Ectothiorhodospiraceae bacterium]|nr:hypothetical protein [Ectothiorhodospiraceae bacterium]
MKAAWLGWAEVMDAWRVVPRLLMLLYGYICWMTWQWFTALPDPGGEQSAFAAVIWGAAAVWWGHYVKTGRDWADAPKS